MHLSPSRIVRSLTVAIALALFLNPNSFGRQSNHQAKLAPRRISFAEGQRLLAAQTEGNLSRQPGKFTRTKLSTGQVLELYYPITTSSPTGRASGARRAKTITVPGYGLLYESELAFKEANRARHVLEDLIPDGRSLINHLPQLVAKLEKRLRLGTGKLDYSRASLKRIDAYLAGYLNSHSTMQTDPQLFQELTAYYGETLRRAINGEWRVREERVGELHVQTEPNLVFNAGGRLKEIKPWSGLVNALYDEDKRGSGLTKVFDADFSAAR